MAYTDFAFYGSGYFGDTLTEETSPKWLERASDELDAITFGRLTFAFPTVEAHAVKVKKAVCAIAEALYWIDVQRRASSAQKAEDGSYHGAVASISTGIHFLFDGQREQLRLCCRRDKRRGTNKFDRQHCRAVSGKYPGCKRRQSAVCGRCWACTATQ